MISRRDWLAGTTGALAWAKFAKGSLEPKDTSRIFASIRFAHDHGKNGVYAIDPEEGSWTQIGQTYVSQARVSPDGKLLAWSKQSDQGVHEGILLRDLSGEETPLTKRAGRVCWSPDGSELIVSRAESDMGEEKSLAGTWRVIVKTGREMKMNVPTTVQIVDWSSDGKTLLALADQEGRAIRRRPLIAIDIDGKTRRTIFEDKVTTHNHSFFPDGRRAFLIISHTNERGLYNAFEAWSINLDGTNRVRFFDALEGDLEPAGLRCSPDRKSFAAVVWPFTRDKNGEKTLDPSLTSLAIIDRDGKKVRKIELPPASTIGLIDWR